jgi:predicted alpha/beta hydrolase
MQTVQFLSGQAGAGGASGRAVPHEVRVEERFEIVADDGVRLAASLYEPVGKPKAALQIHAGMGVKRQFYRHFARYLAERGYAVLSFDVRGMGESRHEPLPRCQATIGDWTGKDMPAALAWLARRFPDVPRFVVGHSLGGQLTGLLPNHELLSGLVLVFAPRGDHQVASPLGKLQGLLLLRMYMPLTIPLFGYAPVRFVMTAQDLPAGVARDWIRQIYHPGWIPGDCAARGEESYYDKFQVPVLSLALDGDALAPPANCAKLLSEYFTGCPSEFVTLRASDAAERAQLTHLGYFRKKFADSRWVQVAAWLDRRVAELAVQQPQALSA